MKEKLISEYVSRMNLDDVRNFAIKNGVELNEEELNTIYECAKKEWKTIIFGNPRSILDDLKTKISFPSYQKIESLYVYFKSKYSNF